VNGLDLSGDATMTWVVLLALLVLVLVVVPLARRRRRLIAPLGSSPLATMSMSAKHEKRKKAALDAATAVLR
jgi:hypothetical protein